LTYFGQDFRCGERGGAPRDRECQAGELYILDLGVGFRGYYSDNARTLAVGGDPTADQQRAWGRIAEVFPMVESIVRPGVSCRGLFENVHAMLADLSPWAFNHHLGHGVGLAPHEGPHLNPNWDDTFQEGDFFAVEPGLYHENLRAGIRLEQNYLVTASGVELQTEWPLGLA
jgi:Xaa-Pro aminopeptidase